MRAVREHVERKADRLGKFSFGDRHIAELGRCLRHRVKVVFDADRNQSDAAFLRQALGRSALLAAKRMGGGNGRMTGEGQFAHRGKNAGAIVRITGRAKQEHGLGEVHLGGDLLHPAGRRLDVGEADGGRVAGERFVGESVDL